MKLLPLVLINLATVGGALVVYDCVRGDPERTDLTIEDVGIDTSSLEERIGSLEAERRPSLDAAQTDPRILERLGALERTLGALASAPASDVPPPSGDVPGLLDRRPIEKDGSTPVGSLAEPTPDDIRRFRQLQKAVRREEQIEKNRARINGALDKLALSLTTDQREAVHAAHAAFQHRVTEIWTEAKAQARELIVRGGNVDREQVVSETTALIQQEFATTLTDIVPQVEADAIAQTLLGKGR